MKTIIIKTQKELDALPTKFDQFTYIEIRSTERIYVKVKYENSRVVARENSSVEAWDKVLRDKGFRNSSNSVSFQKFCKKLGV